MRSIVISTIEESIKILGGDHPPIFSEELVFINFSKKIDLKTQKSIIDYLSNLTTSVVQKVKLSNLKNTLNIENICLVLDSLEDILTIEKLNNEKKLPTESVHSLEIYPSGTNIPDFFDLFSKSESLFKDVKSIQINPSLLDLKKHLNKIKSHLSKLNRTNVYFSPDHHLSKAWQRSSNNIARGPIYVDIDISNSCSHNCVFCGLYNDESVENYRKESKGNASALKIFSQKVSREDFFEAIEFLPDTVKRVTLGGAGEPFTHPDIKEFITVLRNKNINVTVFTHFGHMTPSSIIEYSKLCEIDNPHSMEVIVNFSGATEKTYLNTRPNQNSKSYQNILSMITQATLYFRQHNQGMAITLMSVTNMLNFIEMPLFIGLAKKLDVHSVWIKPIEIHGEEIKKYVITKENEVLYAQKAKLTLHIAKLLNVQILHKYVLDLLVEKNLDEIKELEEQTPFSKTFKQSLLELTPYGVFSEITDIKATTNLETKYEKNDYHYDQNQIIQNSGYILNYLDSNPCNIGSEYIRLQTTGDVMPCCIFPEKFLDKKENTLIQNWISEKYQEFRSETQDFPSTKAHRHSEKYSFCHQCPHMDVQRSRED